MCKKVCLQYFNPSFLKFFVYFAIMTCERRNVQYTPSASCYLWNDINIYICFWFIDSFYWNMLWRNVIHVDLFDLKQDKKIHIYSISESNGALQELQTVDNTGEACDMMYSPDGEYLATAGADRYVRCFKLPNYEVRNNI